MKPTKGTTRRPEQPTTLGDWMDRCDERGWPASEPVWNALATESPTWIRRGSTAEMRYIAASRIFMIKHDPESCFGPYAEFVPLESFESVGSEEYWTIADTPAHLVP